MFKAKNRKRWKKSLRQNDAAKTARLRQEYEEIRQQCFDLATKKKKMYFNDVIIKSNNNPKTLFKMVNKAMDRKQTSPLPNLGDDIPDLQSLENCFNNYFTDKIEKIR